MSSFKSSDDINENENKRCHRVLSAILIRAFSYGQVIMTYIRAECIQNSVRSNHGIRSYIHLNVENMMSSRFSAAFDKIIFTLAGHRRTCLKA